MKIITNNQPRDVIEAHELTDEERGDFEYLNWNAIVKGEDSAQFFRYKGELYDLGEFQSVWSLSTDPFKAWDGYQSDTFFSGIVIKWVPDTDFEQIIVGRYYS